MSKLETVRDLMRGGASEHQELLLSSVAELQTAVSATRASLQPLAAVPKQVENLLEGTQRLQQQTVQSLAEMSQSESQLRQYAALVAQQSPVSWSQIGVFLAASVLGGAVALGGRAILEGNHSSKSARAVHLEQDAHAWRGLLERVKPDERNALAQILKRPIK